MNPIDKSSRQNLKMWIGLGIVPSIFCICNGIVIYVTYKEINVPK